ncbi:hypothetical protein PPACK8108_LOCUS23879 [Phakopsora pachyrhizi]|uniref:Uncharacterized protein n=1 Tax=Phakopsora pachyrhizi TaxID=170000 RepID=A0AAV0BRN1_PHAPC|nr:hypothetical protein PPACK8108_LOCUS23879 [Phakopsora pachyrhizi]
MKYRTQRERRSAKTVPDRLPWHLGHFSVPYQQLKLQVGFSDVNLHHARSVNLMRLRDGSQSSARNEVPGVYNIGISRSSAHIFEDFGQSLSQFDLAYETWGILSSAKDNVILLHIGLSASSHAKIHALNKSFGWWEKFIGHGPNYPIGLDWYFVICTNVLGSCYGSTKPSSIDPETNEPMGPISQSSQSLTQSELSSSCWIILVFPNVLPVHLTTHGKLCHSALIIFDCTTPDHYYLSNCHLIRKSLSTPSFSNLQHFQKRLSSLVSHSPEHQSSLSVQLANHSSAVMDSRTSLKPINDSNNVQNQRLRVNARRPLKDNRRSGKLLTEETQEERLAQRLSTGGTSEDPGQTVGLDNGCKQLPETDRYGCDSIQQTLLSQEDQKGEDPVK